MTGRLLERWAGSSRVVVPSRFPSSRALTGETEAAKTVIWAQHSGLDDILFSRF